MGPRGRGHRGDEYCDPYLACKLPMNSDVVYKNVSMSSGTPTITLMAKSEVTNESGSKRLFRRFLSTTIGKQTTQMPTIAAVTMIR